MGPWSIDHGLLAFTPKGLRNKARGCLQRWVIGLARCGRRRARIAAWLGVGALLLGLPQASPAHSGRALPSDPAPSGRAKLSISGYGFWGNRDLKKSVRLVQSPEEQEASFLDANFVEDAVLVLLSSIREDGYLKPTVEAELTLADGSTEAYSWEESLKAPLPRPLKIRRVRFQIREGVLYHYQDLSFDGLDVIPLPQAERYFVEKNALIPLKSTRIYTPQRLERALSNLREALVRNGYQDAAVTAKDLKIDHDTGAVDLEVQIDQGPQSRVRSVQIEVYGPDQSEPKSNRVEHPDVPYSEFWAQDFTQSLRTGHFRAGFPDAEVQMTQTAREQKEGIVYVDLDVRVNTGPKIELGEIEFRGNKHTQTSILRRQTRLTPGEPLDRIEVEQARSRLSRLGVFDSVSIQYDQVSPHQRDVVYSVEEGTQTELSLLLGWGSYELLRGGFEWDHYNVFGRAHKTRLRAIQSLRSSQIDYLYSTPSLTRQEISLFFTASALRREEIDFVRQELGTSVGGQRYFRKIDSDVKLSYNYELLSARDADSPEELASDDALSASWILDLQHDRRDNPLMPRDGYKLSGSFQVASAAFGGDVDYQRIELKGSVHEELGGGRYFHFGWAHGIGLTVGSDRQDLPINRRFFPGGQNSVRGFQQGEAAPLNDEGKLIGAETFLRTNIELEQALTPTWSVVTFLDGVGFARERGDYPFEETLLSVGGGIRWKSLIGPVRLEYGHNLDPRERDPDGTLHFSIGFPF